MNNIFTKVATIIESCTDFPQLETAVKCISLAGLKGYIDNKEWDLLFYYCRTKQKRLVNEWFS